MRNRTATHRALLHNKHWHWFFATIPTLLQTLHFSAALLTEANASRWVDLSGVATPPSEAVFEWFRAKPERARHGKLMARAGAETE